MVLWGQATSTHFVHVCTLLGTPVLWCPWKPGKWCFHAPLPPSYKAPCESSLSKAACWATDADYSASENLLFQRVFQEWLCST